ncbi:MAG TPA: hypothetical protein VF182_00405 [Candidatus Binatia bacterium]
MTPEDKLRLEELGKFGISIADREWIADIIRRQDEEIERLKIRLNMLLPKIRGQGGRVA